MEFRQNTTTDDCLQLQLEGEFVVYSLIFLFGRGLHDMDHSGIIKKTRVKQKINKTRDENRFLSKSIYTRARVQSVWT